MKRLLSLLSLLVISISLFAEDFVVDGIIYHKTSSNTVQLVRGNDYKNNYYTYSGDIVIPDSIIVYRKYYVTSIGGTAFSQCRGLTSVTIPNSVTSIGESAFAHCSGLKSVTIPNSVTSLGKYAFYDCTSLTSVTIGNGVTSIEHEAFRNCQRMTSLTIGNGVTSIGYNAFSSCVGLTSLTIPNSVKSIGYEAFADCSGLTSLIIGNSVESIGDYAFDGCRGLTSLTIGNSVESIGSNAFSGCSGLTSLTIPNSVKSIGSFAFYNCSGLTSLIIGNSVESIGSYAFSCCSGLTSLIIGNSVESIGNEAFEYCSGLKSVTIPNSVTSIGDYAFSRCSGLTSVTIPNSVKSIGESAFYWCTSLTSVISLNSTPPKTYYSFDSTTEKNAVLMVPVGCKENYGKDIFWGRFKNIQEINNSDVLYTLTYIVDNEVYKTYELKEGDVITPEPEPTKEGYTFSGWSEIPSVMPNHDVTVSGTFTKNGDNTDDDNPSTDTEDDNPSNYKSLDDYIATSSTTLKNYSYTINPIIKNIKKVYIDLTKGTTNSAYCYLGIKNDESTKAVDFSSKYFTTSSDNFIVTENNSSKRSNIKKVADNNTYTWLYYNPKNSNEVIIDVEAYFGCMGYIEGWQMNFGTSCIVNIVTDDKTSETPNTSILTSIFSENSQPPIVGGVINEHSDGTYKEKGIIVSDSSDKLDYDANSKEDVFWTFNIKDYKVIDCTEIGKEQFWCPILNLKSDKDYFVKAYAIQSDGSIIYGQTEKIHSQTFNRYNGTTDYANVYYYNNYTLFDLATDEIILKEDGYYGSTNENPTRVAFKPNYACYKFKTEWNYKLWYYHSGHCVESKRIHSPLITQQGDKLHMEKNPLDSDKNITIYYSINGDYFRPENYKNIYSSPIVISEPCTVYCYGISSDGYISYTNMYVVKDSNSSSAISTPTVYRVREDRHYNLQGQRVLNPKNGIYIVNGKKVFIK